MRLRERLAIGLITASALATVGLGAAAGVSLANRGSTTVTTLTSGSNAGSVVTTTPGAASGSGGASGGGTSGGGGGGSGSSLANTSQNFIQNGTITVGGIFDESGPVDATVERDTVRAYFDQVNAQGGVNGYKLRLQDCDSQFNSTIAHSCSENLVSQGILAVVGWTSVSGEQPETSYLASNGIPIFGGLGVDAEFQTPLSFPVGDPLGRDGYALGLRACQLKSQGVNFSQPGVVYISANFAASLNGGILDGLKSCGITPGDDQSATITDQQSWQGIALNMQEHGDTAVIAALDPYSYGRLFQAMERDDYKVPILAAGLDKTVAEGSYGSLLNGAYSLTPLLEPVGHTNNAAMADYLNTVRRYYPNQYTYLDVYSEGQWIAAHVFVQALRSIKGTITRQALVAAAQALQNFDTGGLTPPLSFAHGGNNDPEHAVQWMHNQDGTANGWVTDSGWVTINYTPHY